MTKLKKNTLMNHFSLFSVMFFIIFWIISTLNNVSWNNLEMIRQFHLNQKELLNEKEFTIENDLLKEELLDRKLENQLFLEWISDEIIRHDIFDIEKENDEDLGVYNEDFDIQIDNNELNHEYNEKLVNLKIKVEELINSYFYDIKSEDKKLILENLVSQFNEKEDEFLEEISELKSKKEDSLKEELDNLKLEENSKIEKYLEEKESKEKNLILEEIKSKKLDWEKNIKLNLEKLKSEEEISLSKYLKKLEEKEKTNLTEFLDNLKNKWEEKISKEISELKLKKENEINNDLSNLRQEKEGNLTKKLDNLKLEEKKKLEKSLEEKEYKEKNIILEEIKSKKLDWEKNIKLNLEKLKSEEEISLSKYLKNLRLIEEKKLEEEFWVYKIKEEKKNKEIIKEVILKKEEELIDKINIDNVFSCNDLYKKWERRNGIYKINVRWKDEKIKVYCDMETSGWGWTLILTSASAGWNLSNIYSENISSPSIEKNYSILDKADGIKTILWDKFKYRIDAKKLWNNWWVWEVDSKYSFISKTRNNTNVLLLEKYWNWDYSNIGIEKRMPYICNSAYGVLSTSRSCNSKWYWTIAAKNKSFSPAPWIYKWERNPWIIWYWVK